jgi:hypothetical protein
LSWLLLHLFCIVINYCCIVINALLLFIVSLFIVALFIALFIVALLLFIVALLLFIVYCCIVYCEQPILYPFFTILLVRKFSDGDGASRVAGGTGESSRGLAVGGMGQGVSEQEDVATAGDVCVL